MHAYIGIVNLITIIAAYFTKANEKTPIYYHKQQYVWCVLLFSLFIDRDSSGHVSCGIALLEEKICKGNPTCPTYPCYVDGSLSDRCRTEWPWGAWSLDRARTAPQMPRWCGEPKGWVDAICTFFFFQHDLTLRFCGRHGSQKTTQGWEAIGVFNFPIQAFSFSSYCDPSYSHYPFDSLAWNQRSYPRRSYCRDKQRLGSKRCGLQGSERDLEGGHFGWITLKMGIFGV